MITNLNFGALKVTHLTFGETRLMITASTPQGTSKLTMLNLGVPGKNGEGVDNFTSDPVAYYILAKN